MVLLTFGSAEQLQNNLITVQFTYGLISPSGSLLRALLLTLNQSQLLCRTQSFVSYPGDIEVYGGPYLYLILQSCALYTFMVLYDSGWRPPMTVFKRKSEDLEKDVSGAAADVIQEENRTERSTDELRLLHLRKDFGSGAVVDDVTFGVPNGQVLALLGPNGAGKTTSISLIRGDLHPSSKSSEILISGHSVRKQRLAARQHLGVCPQFNSQDRVKVKEHLAFYARIRGVPEVAKNVAAVMEAVGLSTYRKRFAGQLSGGNQRKLSLATAIIGNPSVVLLDEPSSGMDALAMRNMWQAIRDVSAKRAVVITTHDMEEADALSDRAVIMDKRLLTVGSPSDLRDRHGKGVYQLHLVNAHDTGAAEMQAIRDWIVRNCPGVTLRHDHATSLHGQIRFKIVVEQTNHSSSQVAVSTNNVFVTLLKLLEESKERFGVEYYTVSSSTLEDVFMDVIQKNRSI